MQQTTYEKNIQKILDDNKDYLESRINEIYCKDHQLVRYTEEGYFAGCFLCDIDRKIGDEIVRENIKEAMRY